MLASSCGFHGLLKFHQHTPVTVGTFGEGQPNLRRNSLAYISPVQYYARAAFLLDFVTWMVNPLSKIQASSTSTVFELDFFELNLKYITVRVFVSLGNSVP